MPLIWLALLFLLAMLNSCKSVKTITPVIRSDSSSIRLHYEHDSIYVHDSIFLRVKGDTVWCDRWHTRYEAQIVNHTDTLYLDRETVTQLPPERYVPQIYKICTILFFILTLLILLRLALKIILRIYLNR